VRVIGCRAMLSRREATSAWTALGLGARIHFPCSLVELEPVMLAPVVKSQMPVAFVLVDSTEVLVLVVTTGFPANEAYGPPYVPRPEPARTRLSPSRTPAATPKADLADLMDTH